MANDGDLCVQELSIVLLGKVNGSCRVEGNLLYPRPDLVESVELVRADIRGNVTDVLDYQFADHPTEAERHRPDPKRTAGPCGQEGREAREGTSAACDKNGYEECDGKKSNRGDKKRHVYRH